MVKTQGDFKLTIMPGSFKTSQITVMLGENGTGKTTFIKMLAEAGKKKANNMDKEFPEVLFRVIWILDPRNEYQLQASNNRP